ncbi:MAG TPA: asparagine synthase (glutamine-hydrolyzing), partial [Gemmatimonadales bacterium]
MCGIAGAVALRPDARPDAERVRRMSALVAHRGPDGDGLWISPSGRACLAHRRLSIIDLATGGQPMARADGEAAIVFNGEIYNYLELRRDLQGSGVALRTESDTEALLHLLGRDGAAALDALRGMFAFAYWDDRAGRLILARDRVGKKPLYHAEVDGSLYFASSIRALRAALPASRPIDVDALDSYLTLGYIPAPLTIHQGVSKLPAGTVMETAISGARKERRFWDLATDDDRFEGSFDDALDALDALLDESVALRLRSDVPLGVFLSGGIDSSLVTALAARRAPGVRTFSISMDDAAFDESRYAAEVARILGTEHHVFRAVPDLLGTLPEMVSHFGEPYADSSALPTWLLARETRRHVTVALGGDGGDEAFAGYNWYFTAARLARLSGMVPSPAYAAAGQALAGLARTGVRLPSPLGR